MVNLTISLDVLSQAIISQQEVSHEMILKLFESKCSRIIPLSCKMN